MIQRNRKRILWAANFTLALALAASVASAFWRLDVLDSPEPADRAAAQTPRLGVSLLRPAREYAVIYQRDLRRPLRDTKGPSSARKAAIPKLNIELIGTAVEKDFSFAMFRTAAGETKTVKLGQSVAGGKVVAIADGVVTLDIQGRRIEIRKPERQGKKP